MGVAFQQGPGCERIRSPSAALQITTFSRAWCIKTEAPLLSCGKSVPASLPEPGPGHLFDHLFWGHLQCSDKSTVPAAVDIVIDISGVDLTRNCEGLFLPEVYAWAVGPLKLCYDSMTLGCSRGLRSRADPFVGNGLKPFYRSPSSFTNPMTNISVRC